MPPRRAGAPRLIDWTGERCVPWAPNVQVVYEHYHRYLWAQGLVVGRRVLDLGSGEGFGSALLADVAREVVGIDIDERTVEHSRLNYAAGNLEFRVASATDLADFPDDAFDAVVAFEVIEHIADQQAVLGEIARVLAPGGVLVLSTPEKHAYAAASAAPNPYHERELTEAELTALLSARFPSIAMFGQRTATGCRIEALTPSAPGRHVSMHIERTDDEWRVSGPLSPLYLIAVAADAPLPDLPTDSTLSDFGLGLVRQLEDERNEALGGLEIARHAAEDALAGREELDDQLIARTQELDSERRRADAATHALAAVEGSVMWRLLRRSRDSFFAAMGGRDSIPGTIVTGARRRVARGVRRGKAARPSWAPIVLPRFSDPEVSIVIPVHDGAVLSERCLRAVLHASDTVSYEVIVVDDQADAPTRALLAVVDGARVIVNEQNLGYLRSVNRGAGEARGRYLVLLNNDTEPQPGWLRALVERAESADDVGVVAAKLVYPDGRLQEAGGIVWRDGVPWNYGKGHDPIAPEYSYAREVDYGSAAALLVRSELWRALEGFDERFEPGYFEDTDLCFAARALGWRVMYEPLAIVVHVEGGAMGTDETTGGKRHQRLNQPKFAEKWHDALRDQPAHPSWDRAHMASDHRRGPHVLVIDHRVPTPDRDSGSLRMWHMLQGLIDLGCRVTFIPDDLSPIEPHISRLRGIGVEVVDGPIHVSQRIAALGPALRLVIVSRPYVAPRYMHLIRQHAPGAVLVYDTVDLHFLREERRGRSVGGADSRVAGGFRELELAIARSADATLVVSEEEKEHLAAIAPEIAIDVMPNAHEIAKVVPGPEERKGLLFVGGFEHEPNVDAAVYLAREVMPRVWTSLQDVSLTIVGSNAPPEVTALASSGIDVPGWVEDLEPLLRESVALVAPLRYGAGLKGKVTQSLAAGLPVVTSSVGAEGLGGLDKRVLLVADDPDAFSERIVELYRSPSLWRELSANGQALADRVCSPGVQAACLRRLLELGQASKVEKRVSAV